MTTKPYRNNFKVWIKIINLCTTYMIKMKDLSKLFKIGSVKCQTPMVINLNKNNNKKVNNKN